jgi:putative ABC transport system ATP-binding protein
MASANSLIKTGKLCKSFSAGGKLQHVIKDLDLDIKEGAFTVIMGSSGSGKSTLLYALSGMDAPSSGEIRFAGENIAAYTNDQLAVFRRKNCGFVFQQVHLMDNMSVMDNVLACGLLVTKDKKALARRAARLFERVYLDEGLWNKFPSQLSGGEAQRAGIVRALINEPAMLFADEPTGSLNSASSAAVLDIMNELHNNGQSILMVTHDLKIAAHGGRIIYLRDGAVYGELDLAAYAGDCETSHTMATQPNATRSIATQPNATRSIAMQPNAMRPNETRSIAMRPNATQTMASRIEKLQQFLDDMGW